MHVLFIYCTLVKVTVTSPTMFFFNITYLYLYFGKFFHTVLKYYSFYFYLLNYIVFDLYNDILEIYKLYRYQFAKWRHFEGHDVFYANKQFWVPVLAVCFFIYIRILEGIERIEESWK